MNNQSPEKNSGLTNPEQTYPQDEQDRLANRVLEGAGIEPKVFQLSCLRERYFREDAQKGDKLAIQWIRLFNEAELYGIAAEKIIINGVYRYTRRTVFDGRPNTEIIANILHKRGFRFTADSPTLVADKATHSATSLQRDLLSRRTASPTNRTESLRERLLSTTRTMQVLTVVFQEELQKNPIGKKRKKEPQILPDDYYWFRKGPNLQKGNFQLKF